MGLIRLELAPAERQLRMFAGIWFPAFVAVVGFVVWHASGSLPAAAAVWGAGAAQALVGLLAPRAIRPAWVVLMIASFPVGLVVSHVLLALVYYLLITPIGLLRRLAGRDALQMRDDPAATTYWVRREPVTDPERHFRQF